MTQRFSLGALLFVFLSAFSGAPTLAATIAQVLANPSTYDGQHVDIKGQILHFEQKVSHKGNPYVTFSLCSSVCIHVFGFGSPELRDGETVTVHGTFAAVKHVSGYTFYNEIDSDDGSL